MPRVKIQHDDPTARRRIRIKVLMLGLDRRKVYTAVDGVLATWERFTGVCSGCRCDCGDGYPCSHGAAGCHECGYTGKRVIRFAAPVSMGTL